MSGRIKSIAIIVVCNLILLAVGLEIFGLGYYAISKGGLFYTSHKSTDFVAGDRAIKILDSVFHPFFGYVHRQNPEWANNEGMGHAFPKKDENCCDIPLIPNDDQIIVGVFGGSVARDFGTYNRKYGLFQKLLTSQYPAFKDKKITIWNFSMSGYRQPQQLMMMTYYLMMGQHFDAVINIDGYNDVYHGMLNGERGIEISFPAEDIWGKMHDHLERLNMQFDDHTGVSSVYFDSLARTAKRDADQCALASCFLINQILTGVYQSVADKKRASFGGEWEKVSHFIRRIPDPENPGGKSIKRNFKDPAKWYDYIGDYWASSSRMMHNLAERHGILYMHLLQPNLHFPTDRKFPIKNETPWTKKFAEPVVRGYPELIKRAEKMRADNINVLTPMKIFDAAKTDKIYIDDCCHYSDEGNRIVTEYIAEKFAEFWKPRQASQQ